MHLSLIEEHYKVNFNKLVKKMSFRAGTVWSAEDIVQEAYVRSLKYQGSFVGDIVVFNKWFTTILHNTFVDFKNSERMYSSIEATTSQEEVVEDSLYSNQILFEIYKKIDSLPEHPKEILELHFKHGYSPKDVVNTTQHSYSKTHQTINRFKQEVHKKYG